LANTLSSNVVTSSTAPTPLPIPSERRSQNILTSEQCQFAEELGIPSNMLRTGSPLSLQANYTRYLVYLDTTQKLANIKNAGTWPSGLKTPTSMDIILLFIGKSVWYDSWSKTFPNVIRYPEMVKWLKAEEDCQSDLEVWGNTQSVYTFSDLVVWLENGGTLVKKSKRRKGERKRGLIKQIPINLVKSSK
jgi:hypothetical protein